MKNIDTTDYILYSQELARKHGVSESILMGIFVARHSKLSENKNGFNGWFTYTYEEILEETGINRTSLCVAIKKLSSLGIISVKRHGFPQKNHFYLHLKKSKTTHTTNLMKELAEKIQSLDKYLGTSKKSLDNSNNIDKINSSNILNDYIEFYNHK